ncbi:MAG: GAF domain-containing protein [Acidobacteria bacterium]|nr:GAF domain-containing protein [Acidobacteriota bacterium]
MSDESEQTTSGGGGHTEPDREVERLRSLMEQLSEAYEQLETVNRIIAAVNTGRSIEEVFELASEQVRALVPFDRASIALCEEGGETLRVYALTGERAGSLAVGARGPLKGSVTELALTGRHTVVIPELSEERRFNVYADLRREGFRSAVCVPLFSMRRAVGSLNLTSLAPDAYQRKHLLALERLAAPLAIAIEKTQLLEESWERNEELRGLFEITRTFTTLSDTADVSRRLAAAICKLAGAEMGLIAAYDRRSNAVRAEAPGCNTPAGLIEEFHFKLERGNRDAPLYLTGESFVSNEPTADERLNRAFAERWGVRSVLSVPLKIKRELIGFIYVANRPGGFSERELRLLEILATQAAETIVNARLFATIQAQAEREAVVNRLLLSLQRGSEPHEKVREVIERVGEVLGLDRCVAVLFADDEHDDYYGEWCAEGVEPITDWPEVRERSPVRYALRTERRPLVAPDVSAHPLAAGLGGLIQRTRLKSLVVVPVTLQGRVIGSISGHQTRSRREWSEDDVDLLVAVATHVGATLENARLISELREASRLKDQFLATLSHELRTPLTAINGWVEMLSESEARARGGDLADGLAAISSSATSLTQLINDLLDLSRIQRGVLRLQRDLLDINELARTAERSVRQSARARKLELRLELFDGLPPTIADAQRVQQILWNLLSNAIKFTPKGGVVSVRTRLADGGGAEGAAGGDGEAAAARRRWIELEVEDTGEGIPADFLPHIWERFRQADATATRRHGGLGIGLSLVKELVEAHGGQIEAASEEGRGSRFNVRLPVIRLDELDGGEA